MKRRGHRKSRAGCRECKRRHIKCDERRPLCSHCLVSQRACTFPETAAPRASALPAPRAPAALEAASPAQTGIPPAGPPSDTVNGLHAELLVHYSFVVSVPEFDRDLERAATKMVLKHALAFAWLLHEVLVISDAREILEGAEIWPLLACSGFARPREKQKGTQLEPLRAWIEELPSSPCCADADRDAVRKCLGAVEALQTGLDDALDVELPSFRRGQVATIWAVLCPRPFHELLQRHYPPALVVLAHYTVLLHLAGDIWQINYTGKPLSRLVAEFLGPAYAEQLECPWAAVGEDEARTHATGEGRRRMTRALP